MAVPRIILVTKSGCGPCGQFLSGPWLKLKDSLSYGIGGQPVEHIDIVTDGFSKLPPTVKKNLNFVPQIFALYEDDKVETPKAALNSPAGLEELKDWAAKGPPRYAATSSTIESDDDDTLLNPRYEVVAVTSAGCPHCASWEASGGLQKFLDGLPASIDKSHYNVEEGPPKNQIETRRRTALTSIPVPSVIVVPYKKWHQPIEANLSSADILRSPDDVRSPEGLANFKRWLALIQDSKTPFKGFLLLATSPSCGHCRQWKDSGGMDQFLATNKSLPGVMLRHNGVIPPAVNRTIKGVPSAIFVPATQWWSPNPEVDNLPDVRNTEAFAEWTRSLQTDQAQWDNDPDYLPQEYQEAAAMRQPRKVSKAPPARRPLRRQAFH